MSLILSTWWFLSWTFIWSIHIASTHNFLPSFFFLRPSKAFEQIMSDHVWLSRKQYFMASSVWKPPFIWKSLVLRLCDRVRVRWEDIDEKFARNLFRHRARQEPHDTKLTPWCFQRSVDVSRGHAFRYLLCLHETIPRRLYLLQDTTAVNAEDYVLLKSKRILKRSYWRPIPVSRAFSGCDMYAHGLCVAFCGWLIWGWGMSISIEWLKYCGSPSLGQCQRTNNRQVYALPNVKRRTQPDVVTSPSLLLNNGTQGQEQMERFLSLWCLHFQIRWKAIASSTSPLTMAP